MQRMSFLLVYFKYTFRYDFVLTLLSFSKVKYIWNLSFYRETKIGIDDLFDFRNTLSKHV